MSHTDLPLQGVRILDLSRVLAGPWASQILADLGAEVLKIERPGRGDDTRAWGPPWLGDSGESAYFASTNRGKRSLAVDLSTQAGRDLVRRLAAHSDVLLENFKVGGAAKLGLGFEALSALNPRLIYCSISGFGQSGPWAHQPGYDFAIQALGGLMSVTGLPDGVPGGGPVKVGVALTDVMTGLYATIGILAALRERDASGLGQHLDLALLDVTVATMANQALNHLASGTPPGRMGNQHPNIVPYEVFATADGHMVLAVGNDAQFTRFCDLVGEDWHEDPRFACNAERVRHRQVLSPLVAEVMARHPTAWWEAALEEQGIPCGAIQDMAAVFAHPQVRHRALELELPHATAGTAPSVASPLRLSRTPVRYEAGPPVLGEHTREVLEDVLGLGEEEVEALLQAGVVE